MQSCSPTLPVILGSSVLVLSPAPVTACMTAGESVDDKFTKICESFQQRIEDAEILQEEFKKIAAGPQ